MKHATHTHLYTLLTHWSLRTLKNAITDSTPSQNLVNILCLKLESVQKMLCDAMGDFQICL